jgi:hypothetical protein
MGIKQSSLLRDMVGFLVGGVVAALASSIILLVFFPLPPEPTGTDHTGEALVILAGVVFFCGGFIGRRAFSLDFWSDMLPSVFTSYFVMVFLCLTASLDLRESLIMIGFASVGIAASITTTLLLLYWFPQKVQKHEV